MQRADNGINGLRNLAEIHTHRGLNAGRYRRWEMTPPGQRSRMLRMPPLRSPAITAASSLLRDSPSLSGASLLSPFVGYTYRVFALHHRPGSHVPRKSQNPARARYTPDAAKAVSR